MGAKQRFTYFALAMVLLVGCSSETESANDTDATGGLDSALSNIASDTTSKSLDIVIKEYREQLDTQWSQFKAAKITAKILDDEQLNKLIVNLDNKITKARGMLERLSKADSGSVAALQKEVADMIEDLPKLYDEVKTKITVLGG